MRLTRLALAASALLLASSCSFDSVARSWNERVGPNGEPVFVRSSTNVGLNLFILVKLFGDTDMAGLIDDLTEDIANENGDRVRVIQSSSENYWYGFPPFTWILTPVVTTVTADYEPTDEELAKRDAAESE
ncbi:MAG: hypothetical protein AAF957_18800 [Planctomycetota bacterium]